MVTGGCAFLDYHYYIEKKLAEEVNDTTLSAIVKYRNHPSV